MSPKIVCGIVMPISTNDAGTEGHWGEVKSIISDSIQSAGFEPNLVSEADDARVIHKRIIQNLYQNEIVVCDVSGINPNVMFELGIRLAFDKPTVIVKDDQTKYPFDTGPIEYVSYRRDLRFASVVDFKAILSKKLSATLSNSKNEGYTSFLRSFGEFTIAKIEAREIPEFDFLVAEIRNLRSLIVANSRASESKSPWEDSDPIQVFFIFAKE